MAAHAQVHFGYEEIDDGSGPMNCLHLADDDVAVVVAPRCVDVNYQTQLVVEVVVDVDADSCCHNDLYGLVLIKDDVLERRRIVT